jgi:transposase InsO family protein
MPFRETCVIDEKVRFIGEYLSGDRTMTSLCERFGISRAWGYALVRRYQAEGFDGLKARSRAPHQHGMAMAPGIAEAIKAIRLEHPTWGPKKLRKVLSDRDPELNWPALSTMGGLLRREGLSQPRRRRRLPMPLTQPFAPVRAPNDLWCIDFKGWFRTGDGERCDPLTLSDADSRFLLECHAVEPTEAGVKPRVDDVFHDKGLPIAMRSDNGPPFAGTGAGGLTRLAVHWIKLGIRLERTDPASPEQNARHERMHATLKAEACKRPAATRAEQQARFERFRYEFNFLRPHEALDLSTPASRYRPSPRSFPQRIEEPVYDSDLAVRRVRSNGEIKWGGDLIFVSEALAGEPVGIAETQDGDWLVCFAEHPLGIINNRTRRLRPFAPARPQARSDKCPPSS